MPAGSKGVVILVKLRLFMKTFFLKRCLPVLILSLFAFGLHKHYISLTEIYYAKEKQSVQITMRFFIDDLEKVTEARFGTELNLATDEEAKEANAYLERYIRQKFMVSINGEEKQYNYLGKEYENDTVFFYLEIEGVESIDEIEVVNQMLFEEFEEQQNYVKLRIGETDKTFILVKANDKEMLKF